MYCSPQSQATICGDGPFRRVTGCVRVAPMGCGSVVQANIRGLPCDRRLYGFSIECGGRREPLPPLLSCGGDALMSVYAGGMPPEALVGGQVVVTDDPCAPCGGRPLASGWLRPCLRPGYPPLPDPRPLFPPVFRSPGESTFY